MMEAADKKNTPTTRPVRLSKENTDWLADEALKLDRSINWLINHAVSQLRLAQQNIEPKT